MDDIADIKRLAGINETDVAERPGPDGSMASAVGKIRSVMNALRQGHISNEQMFLRLKGAVEDLEAAEAESKDVHMRDQI